MFKEMNVGTTHSLLSKKPRSGLSLCHFYAKLSVMKLVSVFSLVTFVF